MQEDLGKPHQLQRLVEALRRVLGNDQQVARAGPPLRGPPAGQLLGEVLGGIGVARDEVPEGSKRPLEGQRRERLLRRRDALPRLGNLALEAIDALGQQRLIVMTMCPVVPA